MTTTALADSLKQVKKEVDELAKWERNGSLTMVNREAHYQALTAVKEHVLTYVAKLVEGMAIEEVKIVPIAGCIMTIRKHMSDMYSGHVVRGNDVIHQFDRTTIPQIAGQLQSLLELYDPDKLKEDDEKVEPTQLLVAKLKPMAEQAENGMVSQLLAILAAGQPAKPEVKNSDQDIEGLIREANEIAEHAKNAMRAVDPRQEIERLKEQVQALLVRVEAMVATQVPTSLDKDKLHDTLHQMQQKHDLLTDRVQQELNILDAKMKTALEKLSAVKVPEAVGPGRTITITVN